MCLFGNLIYTKQKKSHSTTDQFSERSQVMGTILLRQCSHRLQKYLYLEGFLEKSLKIKSAMKNTGKSLKSLEKSLNSTIF